MKRLLFLLVFMLPMIVLGQVNLIVAPGGTLTVRTNLSVPLGRINLVDTSLTSGNGSPEGVVTANAGTIYLRRDGAAGTTFYVKESGVGNLGWVAYALGAPSSATFITQTPDAGLSAEQALSALATGLVKNTTGTGVLSIGVAGTDYQAPGSYITALTGDVTATGPGSVAATISANSVALITDTTGNFVGSVATTAPLAGGAAGSEGAVLTLSITADGVGPTQIDEAANYDWTGIHTFDFDALQIDDTDASHQLIITPGSNLTLDRVLTITTGDAARTITLTGDTTLTGSNTGDQTITLTGDVTGSGTGSFAATVAANAVALTTDTTGDYLAAAAGTANEISVAGSGGEGATATVSLPATIDLGGKTSFELPNAAAPTVDAFGEIAGDDNLWAVGRGAIVAFDGTASTALVGALISDVPSNGQVPKWNTGGTITWENDADTDTGITQLTGDVTAGPGSGSQVATIAADSVALTTDTTGNYVATVTAGAGISGSSAAEGGTPTIAWAPETRVTDITIWDSANASRTLTSGLSGATDPIITFSNNSVDVSTGVLKQGGTAVSLAGHTHTLADITDEGALAALNTVGTTQIDNDAVTYAKIQNVSAASRLLGRGSAGGAGDVEEITLGANLTMTGTSLAATDTDTGITQLTGDVTAGPGSGSQVATISADSVALTTDTTGNYVASANTSILTGLTGGSAGSEGAALSLAFDYSQALTGDVGLGANAAVFGASGLVFEGSTANLLETFISVTDPTVDRTITIPDRGGTVSLSGDTLTGDVTATLESDGSTVTTIAADSVALGTDTTGNYVSTAAGTTGRISVIGSGSETAAITIDIDNTLTLAGNPTLSANGIGFGTTGLIFEGSTADLIEGLLTASDPTSTDKTWTLPDRNGTISISGDAFTGDVTGTLNSSGSTALTIAADSVALSTDTTGNYVASANTSVLTGLTGGSAGSEGAALSLAFDYSQALTGDVGLGANAAVFGASGLVFEGATANLIETFISVTDPTVDRTITIPDRGGTVSLSGDTFTGDVTGTLNSTGATALTVAADSVALTTDTTGNYVASANTSALTGLTGGSAGSEGAALSLALDYSQALSGDPAYGANAGAFGASGLIFEGATANLIETFISITDPTVDRTITIPDRGGTVSLSGDTFTGDVTGTLASGGATALTVAADSVALATDTTGNYVATIAGTANQVIVSGSGSENAAVTLSTPQDIATTSTPQFLRLGLGEAADAVDKIEVDIGTVTAATRFLDMSGTWNNGAVTFAGIYGNLTDTASGGASAWIQLQVGAVDVFNLRKNGTLNVSGNVIGGGGNLLGWNSRSLMASPSDGVITIENQLATDFNRLQFGGTTASFPALKRSTTQLQVRLADDSADAPLSASALTEGANAVPNATDHLGFFAATTSAQLAGVVSDEQGSGALVFATSPTLTTPNIGSATGTGISFAIVTKVFADSPYTATASDYTILCNATGGAITINLPASASHSGRIYNVKKTDSSVNAVTIDGNAAETIDGATTRLIGTQYHSLTIQSDGSNWHIL